MVTERRASDAGISVPPGSGGDASEALLEELLASVGVLAAMLQERIDPAGCSYRDLGRLCRLLARERGMADRSVERIALAAHLYGLDLALRREVGDETRLDPVETFGARSATPGGLGPSLRSLGACALGLTGEGPAPEAALLLRLAARSIELRIEAEAGALGLADLARLLEGEGGDPPLVQALVQLLEHAAGAHPVLESGLTARLRAT